MEDKSSEEKVMMHQRPKEKAVVMEENLLKDEVMVEENKIEELTKHDPKPEAKIDIISEDKKYV